MFSISKHEIMDRISVKATEIMTRDEMIKLPGFGIISYNVQDKTFKFEPDNQLIKCLRMMGKY